MSVLIKGMAMPTRCEDCFCYRHNAEYDYAYCNISSTNVLGHGNARLNSCPLVPVPPHGDLIDRDALAERLGITDMDCFKCAWGNYGFCGRGGDFNDACEAIEDAPTIIHADPAKEGER